MNIFGGINLNLSLFQCAGCYLQFCAESIIVGSVKLRIGSSYLGNGIARCNAVLKCGKLFWPKQRNQRGREISEIPKFYLKNQKIPEMVRNYNNYRPTWKAVEFSHAHTDNNGCRWRLNRVYYYIIYIGLDLEFFDWFDVALRNRVLNNFIKNDD